MPRIHELKTWPAYWQAVESGEKTFEVRRDDRGFQKGDILVLQLYDPEKRAYMRDPKDPRLLSNLGANAAEIEREVSWILTGGQMGVEPGFVVMGLKPLSN